MDPEAYRNEPCVTQPKLGGALAALQRQRREEVERNLAASEREHACALAVAVVLVVALLGGLTWLGTSGAPEAGPHEVEATW